MTGEQGITGEPGASNVPKSHRRSEIGEKTHKNAVFYLVLFIASAPAVWDIEAVPTRATEFLMRFASIRTLRAASGVVLLWLLSAVAVDAAPAARRMTYGAVCDAQTVSLKKLRRQAKAFGGPLKRFMKRRLPAALTDTTPRVLRGASAHLDDDDAAIQNDATAARIDDDERPIPALQPAGLLHGSRDQRPRSRAFSPRSPRGPPPYA